MSVAGDAAVDERDDVRMVQRREDLTFGAGTGPRDPPAPSARWMILTATRCTKRRRRAPPVDACPCRPTRSVRRAGTDPTTSPSCSGDKSAGSSRRMRRVLHEARGMGRWAASSDSTSARRSSGRRQHSRDRATRAVRSSSSTAAENDTLRRRPRRRVRRSPVRILAVARVQLAPRAFQLAIQPGAREREVPLDRCRRDAENMSRSLRPTSLRSIEAPRSWPCRARFFRAPSSASLSASRSSRTSTAASSAAVSSPAEMPSVALVRVPRLA